MLFQYFIIHFRIRTLFIEQIHTKADADVIYNLRVFFCHTCPRISDQRRQDLHASFLIIASQVHSFDFLAERTLFFWKQIIVTVQKNGQIITVFPEKEIIEYA